MAEAAIRTALHVLKLTTSQSSEFLFMFSGPHSGMRSIMNELELMQDFLNERNTVDHNNLLFGAWLKDVHNLAYNIHDIVNEFVDLTGPKKYGGIQFYFKKLFKVPKYLIALKRVTSQIQISEKNLQSLGKVKVQWLPNMNVGLGKTPHDPIEGFEGSCKMPGIENRVGCSDHGAVEEPGDMFSLVEKSEVKWTQSFDCLPRNLKYCFVYCSMFPKDHLIKRKKPIRLWIAEDFIDEKGLNTLEEVAEGYLEELIHRELLQVVKKNTFGRIKRCRMPHALRKFAISLCMKENFGLLHEDDVNFGLTVDKSKTPLRLSAVKMSSELWFNKNLSQLRTFLSFDSSMLLYPLLSSTLLHFTYLSVLDLEGLPIKTLPKTIGDLFNLRYLGLRRTKVKSLPKSIGRLCNLQTLDLVFSNIKKLPSCITKFKKLRHLFAEVESDGTYLSFQSNAGICIPRGMFDFKPLQTLQALKANAEVVKILGNLDQLRSFRISHVKENYCPDLCTELSKMSFLSFLDINASSENEFLQLEHLHSPPPKLQKLNLTGRLNENIFQSRLFQICGKNFQTLYLSWSRLQNDPLPSLSYLSSLTRLHLNRAYDGQRLVFRAGWFPKLKVLILKQLLSLIDVAMEKDTMMSLERINLRYMEQLEEIPKGMEQIKSLKLVYCQALSCNFWGSKKEGTYQIEHFKCRIC